MTVTFKLTGGEAMSKRMRALAVRVPRKFGQQLRLQGEQIVTLSKQSYVPRNFGTLANSARVSGPDFNSLLIEVQMTFGGAAAAYARAIHEHPSSSSPLSWKGKTLKFQGGGQRGVKYLERPMKVRSIGMAGRIARGVLPL